MKANVIFGIHPVRRALLDGTEGRLLMIAGKHSKRLDELRILAEDKGVPLEWTAKQNLDEIAGQQANHQSVVLLADGGSIMTHKIHLELSNLA